jgi:hypothetical protein
MPPPPGVKLGPLTRALLDESVWSSESLFPAWQEWADDAENVLSFLREQGVLDAFRARLRAREWEGAFAEARVGFFLSKMNFRVLAWEPEAVKDRPGDIDVQYGDTEPIFVEVKGPGWEGELTHEERKRGRSALPKHVDMEARAIDSIGPSLYAVDKAIPKFDSARCNMVAINDDLFRSPVELPKGWLDGSVLEHLKQPRCSCVGGVLFLYVVKESGGPVEYRHHFIANPTAGRPLPEAMVRSLVEANWHDTTSASPLDGLGLSSADE